MKKKIKSGTRKKKKKSWVCWYRLVIPMKCKWENGPGQPGHKNEALLEKH
jgi:hypothetical protein